MPRLDFRPAIQEPVYLILSRQQVESGDTQEPMVFLQHLVSSADTALEFKGPVSTAVIEPICSQPSTTGIGLT